jgi:hypothetical protein
MSAFQPLDQFPFQTGRLNLLLMLKLDNGGKIFLAFNENVLPGVHLRLVHPVVLPNNSTLFIIPLYAGSDEQAAAALEN